jgi:hypothetical protein
LLIIRRLTEWFLARTALPTSYPVPAESMPPTLGELSATRTKDGTAFELDTVTGAASEWIEWSDDSWWHPINEKPKKQ